MLDSVIGALANRPSIDEVARAHAHGRWACCAHPLGSLGLLEEAIESIAALTGDADVRLAPRELLVLCASNGVIAEDVAQSDDVVTRAVTRGLAEGRSSVCTMARVAHCEVVPVDMGVADMTPTAGLLDRRIANGTGDIACGPAMTHEEAIRALEVGIELACDAKERGVRLLAIGEMGIGNTTTTAAVASVLLGRDSDELCGRGAGLDDQRLARKRAVVRKAITVNLPDPADPIDVLAKVGGFDLAGLAGVCLGAAASHIPALLDGVITLAAALCAVRLAPAVRSALIASHASAEPATSALVGALGVKPLIAAGLRLGEGTGAIAAMPMLDMACALYQEGATFDSYGIDAYEPWDADDAVASVPDEDGR